VALFDTLDFGGAPQAGGVGVAEVEEWSKDERLEMEKELLGFYVTGHPLDKFRRVLDSDRFCKLGLVDEIEIQNPRDRFPFAGMIRSVESKMTRSGKPFGVLVVEDFTGSREVVVWGESFVPARDAGILAAGKVVRFKAQIQIDDRTDSRRLTGSEIAELKMRGSGSSSKHVELALWTARHSEQDLKEIREILLEHPGKTPVLIHFQNSAGKRATIEVGEAYMVRRSARLEAALGRWLAE
jgi:DNA polymerase-3 subunit alpha